MRQLARNVFVYISSLILMTLVSCSSVPDVPPSGMDSTTQSRPEAGPELSQTDIENGDYVSLYRDYSAGVKQGPVIPGLFQGVVPQGLAYRAENDLFFISNYMFDERPSCITVVQGSTGEFIKTLWLFNQDGSPHKGHVGGLAVSEKYLWVASGENVYAVSFGEVLNGSERESRVYLDPGFRTDLKASFLTYQDRVLWIGEFTSSDGTYRTDPEHHYKTEDDSYNRGWLGGFPLDPVTDLISIDCLSEKPEPAYIISIPHEVQGAVFLDDKLVLSRSYGRRNDSRISIYDNPLMTENMQIHRPEISVPFWALSGSNLVGEYTCPPMTEGLALYRGEAAVLFESGSDKYRSSSKNPQGRLHFLGIQ